MFGEHKFISYNLLLTVTEIISPLVTLWFTCFAVIDHKYSYSCLSKVVFSKASNLFDETDSFKRAA